MTETTKAIRSRTVSPRYLGINAGLLLALVVSSSSAANAQVVQVAGERPETLLGNPAQLIGNSGTRVSSRRVLIEFPSDAKANTKDDEKAEASPSDAAPGIQSTQSDKAAEAKNAENADGNIPAQSAQLSLTVEPVNIATGSIGTGVLPDDTAAKRAPASSGLKDGQSRGIPVTQVSWKPANVCHLPLYFEDAMLERHGHVRWGHAQPIVSGAKFLATMPLLPYLKTLQPPCEYRYTLGHFRPGSCAPALKDHLPWDRRAAVVETVSLGAFFWAAPL